MLFGKKIVEFKYRVNDPNLFCCPDINFSPFWKGVLWAVKAAQVILGKLGMVSKSVSGKIDGLALLASLSISGLYMS